MSTSQRHREAWLLLFYMSFGAGLTTWIGQDLDWDLLNYHFYNTYMLMNGRIARDVHVAGIQTFLNPLLDFPFYAAFQLGVSPRVFFTLLGALHGSVLFAVHKVTELILPAMPRRVSWSLAMLAALTAGFGAGFRSEIGNTMHDDTLAIPILGALWLILRGASKRVPASSILAPGAIAGAAAGLKLAMLPMCIGLAAVVIAIGGQLHLRLKRISGFALAGAVGVLVTGGYWMWIMNAEFGSPLFPFFNRVFGSTFAPAENFSDPRFLPQNLLEAVLYPFLWVDLQVHVTEQPFRDFRIAAALVVVGVFTPLWLVSNRTSTSDAENAARTTDADTRLMLLSLFWIVAYVVWLRQFSIYRYIVVLEVLSAAVVVAALARILAERSTQFVIAVLLCGAMSLWSIPPNWGRVPWSSSYFGVDATPLQKYEHATILLWDFPTAYLAPLFPRSSTFVRVVSNWGLSEDTTMWLRLKQRIDEAPSGKAYLIQQGVGANVPHEIPPAVLQRFDLELVGTCEGHASFHVPFRICGLRRRGAG